MSLHRVETSINGKTLSIETGKLARLATSSCVVQYGETSVLGTIVVADKPREGMDFLPLKVDFDEKFYAAGKIKGSRFIKREGRPAEEATLVARAIDRTLRPLFPKGFYNEVQIILTVLSYDGQNSADMVAAIAASTCLRLSTAPTVGPVMIARIGKNEAGQCSWNPTNIEREEANLDVIVGTLQDKVVMIESTAKEAKEEEIFDAIQCSLTENKKITDLIEDLHGKVGKTKLVFTPSEYNQELFDTIYNAILEPVTYIYGDINKIEREVFIKDLKEKIEMEMGEGEEEKTKEIHMLFDKAMKKIIRDNILQHEKRVGGRNLDQIRPLFMEVDVVPRVHGSALFQRGETQSLCITTLGSPSDAQTIDNPEKEETKRYMHHYNFPPFSVGSISTRRFTGNREIGHGSLAEKALLPVLPCKEEFPYTIRVVNEILESNGSSSMASCCGSTLSLLEAGVPITKSVGGIAMGLMINDTTGDYKVLTDLQDIEDFGGDMDFKVAGTVDGVTAIQVDMKIQGLTFDIIKDALDKAKAGRIEIITAMNAIIAAPKEMKPNTPRIITTKVDVDDIRIVIGKGGETINKIIEETGVDISIEDDGLVYITSADGEGAKKALEWVERLVKKLEIGEIYDAKVVRVMPFGAIVELLPGKDALCHISEIAHQRIENIEDVVKIGATMKVKVMKIENDGKVAVSRKILLEK